MYFIILVKISQLAAVEIYTLTAFYLLQQYYIHSQTLMKRGHKKLMLV